jgi:large subunit ribosomal protein L4
MPDISVKVHDTAGKVVGKLKLSEEIFGAEYNEALIHQVVVAQAANKRQGTKSTLTRTEVRGGGIKPWRQKGTGRARQGSIRAPQWIKGGVVFAPKPRDFDKKVNKKARDAALKSALSYKVKHDELIVLDDIKLKAPKTKEVAKILDNLKIDKNTLFVIPAEYADVVRASANIPFITTTPGELINVYDIVNHTKILTTAAAIKKIEEVFA